MTNHSNTRQERRRRAAEQKRIQQKKRERALILAGAILLVIIAAISIFSRKGKTPGANTGTEAGSEAGLVNNADQTGSESGGEGLTLTLLGDVSFGSNGGKKRPFDEVWLAQSPQHFTRNLADKFQASDAVVASLKNAFVPTTTDTPIEGKEGPYKAYRREYVQFFKSANITYLNMATNHTGDYGQKGFDETVAWLTENGIKTFGTHTMPTTNPYFGQYETDVTQIVEKNGIKVGLVGFMGYNGAHPTADQVRQKTEALRGQGCQYIIGALTAGDQGTATPANAQRTYAYMLADNGVDLVYGSGAHIVQPYELYNDKPIYYGLGNFFFIDYADTVSNPLSLMLEVSFKLGEDGKIRASIKETPLRWTGETNKNTYQPMVATDQADIAAINAIVHESSLPALTTSPEEGGLNQEAPQGTIPRVTAGGIQAPAQTQAQTENSSQEKVPAQTQGPAANQVQTQVQTPAQAPSLKIPRIKAAHASLGADTEAQTETQTEN